MLRQIKKKIISIIKNKLKTFRVYENPYKLTSKFEKIPNEIQKKISRDDFKLKKCTI